MPLDLELLGELLARTPGDEIAGATAPLDPAAQPLPPWPRAGSSSERRVLLEAGGHRVGALCDPACLYPDEAVRGNIEGYVGVARVPVGIIGPLRVRGAAASGDFLVPMATTEGALVASYGRGAKVASLAGGVSAVCMGERVGRAPGFVFASLGEAARFVEYVGARREAMADAARTTTRHGALADVRVAWDGNVVCLLLEFVCGEAAGQNMATLAAEAACRALLDGAPVSPRAFHIDVNLSSDKKATHLTLGGVRGKRVTAECVLPAELVARELHASAEEIERFWRLFTAFGVESGAIGMQGHYANALAAIYLACGQDVACVAESSVGRTRMERTDEGDLRVVVNLPGLVVGTVGGGTALPTQRECLELMGCVGEGSARRLAEICAAVALCGELSGAAALAAGHFTAAHRTLGRK